MVEEPGMMTDPPVIGGADPETLPHGGGVDVTLSGKNLDEINGVIVTDRNGKQTRIAGALGPFEPSAAFPGEVVIFSDTITVTLQHRDLYALTL